MYITKTVYGIAIDGESEVVITNNRHSVTNGEGNHMNPEERVTRLGKATEIPQLPKETGTLRSAEKVMVQPHGVMRIIRLAKATVIPQLLKETGILRPVEKVMVQTQRIMRTIRPAKEMEDPRSPKKTGMLRAVEMMMEPTSGITVKL